MNLTFGHPPQGLDKYGGAIRLAAPIEGVAASPLLPPKTGLALSRVVANHVLLQGHHPSALLAAVGHSRRVLLGGSLRKVQRWREPRVGPESGAVNLVTPVIGIT